MHYDPTLTFEAIGDRLDATKSPGRAQDIANALREAYEDGWHDARARQLAGLEIPETPHKG